jgi:hypothetical protein
LQLLRLESPTSEEGTALEELSRRSALYDVDKRREVRSGDYAENGIELSRRMFEVNRKKLKFGGRAA